MVSSRIHLFADILCIKRLHVGVHVTLKAEMGLGKRLHNALNTAEKYFTDHLHTMTLFFCSFHISLTKDPVVVASVTESTCTCYTCTY